MDNLYLDGEEPIHEKGSGEGSAETGEEVQNVQQEINGVNILRYEAMDKAMGMLPEPFLGHWN